MAKKNVLDDFMAGRKNVSYETTQVDPATVAALNAGEDRGGYGHPALAGLSKDLPPARVAEIKADLEIGERFLNELGDRMGEGENVNADLENLWESVLDNPFASYPIFPALVGEELRKGSANYIDHARELMPDLAHEWGQPPIDHDHNDRLELNEAARNREIERQAEEKSAAMKKLLALSENMDRATLDALPRVNPSYEGPEVHHGIPHPDDGPNPFEWRDASSLDAATRALVDKAWGHTLREAQEKAGYGPEYLAPAPLPNPDREVDEILARLVEEPAPRSTQPPVNQDQREWERHVGPKPQNQFMQRVGIREAIQRGAILSEGEKAPNVLDRFLEAHKARKYEKAVKTAAAVLGGDIPKPASVERKDEQKVKQESSQGYRW